MPSSKGGRRAGSPTRKLPKAAADAVRTLEAIAPRGDDVLVRKVFGQPAAFVNGQMFLGVFGEEIFVRLQETDRLELARTDGAVPFEPMPGRPMKEYVVLPAALRKDRRRLAGWVSRSLEYASQLPPKASRRRAR